MGIAPLQANPRSCLIDNSGPTLSSVGAVTWTSDDIGRRSRQRHFSSAQTVTQAFGLIPWNLLTHKKPNFAASPVIIQNLATTAGRNPTDTTAMAGADSDHVSPFAPLMVELARMRKSNLNAAIDDVDQIIDLLTATREQVAGGWHPKTYLIWGCLTS